MFKPLYRIHLGNSTFPPDNAMCLGLQMIKLIKYLTEILPPHIWYSSDVDGVGIQYKNLKTNSHGFKKIGNTETFANLCKGIDQFYSGVFIALQSEHSNFISEPASAEDEEFRCLDIEGVLIEIRAFDTSYFEIYSEKEEFIKKFSEKFNTTFQKK